MERLFQPRKYVYFWLLCFILFNLVCLGFGLTVVYIQRHQLGFWIWDRHFSQFYRPINETAYLLNKSNQYCFNKKRERARPFCKCSWYTFIFAFTVIEKTWSKSLWESSHFSSMVVWVQSITYVIITVLPSTVMSFMLLKMMYLLLLLYSREADIHPSTSQGSLSLPWWRPSKTKTSWKVKLKTTETRPSHYRHTLCVLQHYTLWPLG